MPDMNTAVLTFQALALQAAAVVLAGTQDSSRRAATHLTLGLLKSQPGQAHCLMLLRVRLRYPKLHSRWPARTNVAWCL